MSGWMWCSKHANMTEGCSDCYKPHRGWRQAAREYASSVDLDGNLKPARLILYLIRALDELDKRDEEEMADDL